MSKKTQHILVLIQDKDNISNASIHAFKLAEIFKANVAFVLLSKKKEELPKDTIESCNPKKIVYTEYKFQNLSVEPNNCIKQLEVIFIVSEFPLQKLNHFYQKNEVFKYLNRAKIPSILVSKNTNTSCDYRNIIVPVNYRKESKEKMIWASYFGRFNQAKIHLYVANEKSESIQQRIKANLLFTKKMYEQFKFEYQIIKASNSSTKLQNEAFQYSEKFNSDLIVLLSLKNNEWFNNFFGSPQIKKLLLKKKNPILLINPLKDYYLPCH